MATDVPAVKAKLLEERAVVAAMVALIDIADEQAKMQAAQVTLDAAQRVFDKKSERWTLVNEKLARLELLDAQIALFTP